MGVSDSCVVVLGGSFDPVHSGHVALGEYFVKLLFPDTLRLIPAGNPWQKTRLCASVEDRVEMLRLAFHRQTVPVNIDLQEIERGNATYTIDTLQALRKELGPATSIAFVIGADQLQQLYTWKDWQELFNYAHICAASRPGFAIQKSSLAKQVANEFNRRNATPEQIRQTSHGLTYVAPNLAWDVSATQIRAALQLNEFPEALIPPTVLDYIKQHHLYQN